MCVCVYTLFERHRPLFECTVSAAPLFEYTFRAAPLFEYTFRAAPLFEYTFRAAPLFEYTFRAAPLFEYTFRAAPLFEYTFRAAPLFEYTFRAAPTTFRATLFERQHCSSDTFGAAPTTFRVTLLGATTFRVHFLSALNFLTGTMPREATSGRVLTWTMPREAVLTHFLSALFECQALFETISSHSKSGFRNSKSACGHSKVRVHSPGTHHFSSCDNHFSKPFAVLKHHFSSTLFECHHFSHGDDAARSNKRKGSHVDDAARSNKRKGFHGRRCRAKQQTEGFSRETMLWSTNGRVFTGDDAARSNKRKGSHVDDAARSNKRKGFHGRRCRAKQQTEGFSHETMLWSTNGRVFTGDDAARSNKRKGSHVDQGARSTPRVLPHGGDAARIPCIDYHHI